MRCKSVTVVLHTQLCGKLSLVSQTFNISVKTFTSTFRISHFALTTQSLEQMLAIYVSTNHGFVSLNFLNALVLTTLAFRHKKTVRVTKRLCFGS